ncbi:hypothetical protein [Pseudaminobacter sp. NGMCC 1.201702]|uniref:hypothetical protein n=1 Tax=Pseudaminobacter sp. NGMCC 1.201702 TaxID=3391825 RepID=UPI0039EE590C
MLRISPPNRFLTPEDLDVLARVFQTTRRAGDTLLDLECRAATLVQLFHPGSATKRTFTRRCDVPVTGLAA